MKGRRKEKKLLYGLMAVVTLLFIVWGEGTGTAGYVLGGDSEACYIHFRHHIGVAPLYPLFLHVLQLIFGEGLYLDAAAVLQMLFLAFSVVFLVYTISEECRLVKWERLVIWAGSMLPFAILLPEDPVGHTIMVESITYPLLYLFVAFAAKAVFKKEERKLAPMVLLSIIAGLVRPQMLFLFAVLGVLYVYIILCRIKEYGGAGCMKRLVLYFILLAVSMKSVSWLTVLHEKIFFNTPYVAFSDQTLVQHMLYLADEEDAGLFEDEMLREIFLRCVREMDTMESNYKYQPEGLLAWREIVRDCGTNSYMLTDVIEEYLEPQGLLAEEGIDREIQIADISHRLAYPLLRAHWKDKLGEAFTLMKAGFISTVLFHKERIYGLIHIATLLFYIFGIGTAAFCILKEWNDKSSAEYMLLALGMSVVNVVSCNLIHFGLQRYLAYTLGLNWMGMFLILRKLYQMFFHKGSSDGGAGLWAAERQHGD